MSTSVGIRSRPSGSNVRTANNDERRMGVQSVVENDNQEETANFGVRSSSRDLSGLDHGREGAELLYGTVCSVAMDLKNRVLHITRGSPCDCDFEQLVFSDATGGAPNV